VHRINQLGVKTQFRESPKSVEKSKWEMGNHNLGSETGAGIEIEIENENENET